MSGLAFIPGFSSSRHEPLGRFIAPTLEGIIDTWLKKTLGHPSDKWIIDPFCASPRLIIEAAQAGWRILVAANNPIHRFLLEVYANPPSETTFQAALADFGAAMRGTERLELHIRSLYTVACQDCSSPVEVDAFIWEKDAETPRTYLATCRTCGATGEKALFPHDSDRAKTFASSSLHRFRAIERVASADDPDRIHVEEALSVYLPRAVYCLFILLNKLDGLSIPTPHRTALHALMLNAFDSANTLWAYPTERSRPRQLVTPSRFRENNIWKSLENGIVSWKSDHAPVPLTIWPETPDQEGGICIYEGPLRELSNLILKDKEQFLISAIISALPRPNQAFWTLSALWSGWLWGKEVAAHFKSVLRRRRYDWVWHYTALKAAFESLALITPDESSMLLLTGEAEMGLLTSAIIAASESGFSIKDIALRGDQAQINAYFSIDAASTQNDFHILISQSVKDFLGQYGQPAPFLNTWTAGLLGLENSGALRRKPVESKGEPPGEPFIQTQNALRETISYRGGFLRFGSGENLENSLFWIKKEAIDADRPPISPYGDRLEMAVVNALVHHSAITTADIESEILPEFPGLLTPEKIWIQMILESYGTQDSGDTSTWHIRMEDIPENRHKDLARLKENLARLANLIGYAQSGDFPLLWKDNRSVIQYWLYPIASAIFTNLVLGKTSIPLSPADQSIIVLPGGRANLVLYKIRRDPRLAQVCLVQESDQLSSQTEKRGWRFLKSRHVRWLLDNYSLLQQPLEKLIERDPLTFSAPQIRLL